MEERTGKMAVQIKKTIISQQIEYASQVKHNEQSFYELLQRFRPDLYVFADLIDSNKLNMLVVFKIVRQLINIAQGSHWGRIIVNIKDNVVQNIDGIDSDKVDENIFLE